MHPRLIGIFSAIHLALYRVTNGFIGANAGGPMLLLTTIGRKSGKPRTRPLLYLRDDSRYVVVASYGGNPNHPAWWLNLVEDPSAEIQIGSEHLRVHAREATDEERARLWPRLVALWPGYNAYQARTERKIPVVILEPA